MASTSVFPFGIKQSNPNGCIPTNISTTLHALGIHGITEENLFQAYFSTICFKNIVDLQVLSKLIINGRPLSDFLSVEFYDATSFENWWTHVTDWLLNNQFVLFAFKTNGDSHTRTAVNFVASSNTLATVTSTCRLLIQFSLVFHAVKYRLLMEFC